MSVGLAAGELKGSHQKNWTVSKEKPFVCVSLAQFCKWVYIQIGGVCARVCTNCVCVLKTEGKGEEGGYLISNMTSFPENIYLIFHPFQAKLVSLIAPQTSLKINSGVFEIPEWICQGCLA